MPTSANASPDGSRVYVTNGVSGTISVIGEANTVEATFRHLAIPSDTAVSPDGGVLYVANQASREVAVLDSETGKRIDVIKAVDALSLAISPDGSRLYSTGLDSADLSFIDTGTRKVAARIRIGGGAGTVLVSPSGDRAYVVSGGDATLSTISTDSGVVVSTVPLPGTPSSAAISPDGNIVYVSSADAHVVSIVDTHTQVVVGTLTKLDDPRGIAVSADGQFLFVADGIAGTLNLVDIASGEVSRSTIVGMAPTTVTANAQRTMLYVTNSFSKSVTVVSIGSETMTRPGESTDDTSAASSNSAPAPATTLLGPGPVGLTLSQDGTRAYVVDSQVGTLSTIDTSTHSVVSTTDAMAIPSSVAVNPRNTRVYVGGVGTTMSRTGYVYAFDAGNGKTAGRIEVGEEPSGLAISPDGTRGYVANWSSGTISVFNTATNRVIKTIKCHRINPGSVSVSPDGTRLYALAGYNGGSSLEAYDANGGALLYSSNIGPYPSHLIVSPDGATLWATNEGTPAVNPVSEDELAPASGSVLKINAADGRSVNKFRVNAHPGAIALSTDGKRVYVASASPDSLITLDATSGTVLDELPTDALATDLASSPTAATLYTLNQYQGTMSTFDFQEPINRTDSETESTDIKYYAGDGDKVLEISKPSPSPMILRIHYRGTRNFIVWTLDESLQKKELLVNTQGPYFGTVPLDFDNSQTTRLKVDSDGSWTIDVAPLTLAPQFTGTVRGLGDTVLVFTGNPTAAAIANQGEGNFIVWTYDGSGADLATSEVGNYRGDIVLPQGPAAVTVSSSGTWVLEPQP